VLLAVQYPRQTNTITQPWVHYIHTAMPHASCTLLCASCQPLPPPKKKFSPFLTGDINPQSSHWNNGKMKIAYNSAYIQKCLILPSPSNPLLCMSIFVPISKKLLHRTQILNCAMPSADESNNSATGKLHPQCSATCVLYVTFVTLHCPIPKK